MQILEQAQDLPKAGNIKAQWVSLWTGPAVGVVLLAAALAFPGFWPPMSPAMNPEQVATFYADHTAWIRLSQVTFNLCGIMIVPLLMVIVVQMKRMKGQSHVFAYCFLTAVVSGATIFALSNVFFLVAAFRPERDPALVQLLNDLAWIVFIAPVGMVVSQFVLLALAVYFDDRTRSGLPPVGRTFLVGDRRGDGARRGSGGLPDRPAGLGRVVVVLGAQRRVRGVRHRHVLRAA